MFNIRMVLFMGFLAYAMAKTLPNEEGLPSVTDLCALVPGATILRPNTCTNWIKCPTTPDGLDFEEGSCVFGLHFNKNEGHCQYKEEMVCPYELQVKTKNRCTHAPEGTFLEDLSDCRGYVFCRNGQEEKSACPNTLVFNPKKAECVYEHQYKCPKRSEMAHAHPICLSLPDNTYFADQIDCTKYAHCMNGSLSSHICEDEKAWDNLLGKCVKISNVTCFPSAKKPAPENTVCATKNGTKFGPVPDDNSCMGYYFCKKIAGNKRDRDPEHFKCEAGTFFDSLTLSCRDRLNVKCPLDRCEGMGNKYVNIAGDCKAYALCANGKASSYGSCPDNHFFDERTQGCTPNVVSYAACSA